MFFGELKRVLQVLVFVVSVYVFLLSIRLLSSGLKMLGSDFVKTTISSTSDPLTGLFVGILATSFIQSSSATTSIVVSLVAANPAFLPNAIPIVMGANIGTTVTNTLVSFGHATRRKEFSRALAGATVHDFFNLIAVFILFPIEMLFHPLQTLASMLGDAFAGVGGLTFVSPLKMILAPLSKFVVSNLSKIQPGWLATGLIISAAIGLLIFSLNTIVQSTRRFAETLRENIFEKYLFKTAFLSFSIGLFLTAIVQSSSVTTSMSVPLVGAGLISIEKVFPYVLGANIGTTVTALLAALGSTSVDAIKIALVHLLFNIAGICLVYPVRFIPINLAKRLGKFAAEKRRYAIAYVVLVFYIIPILYIIIRNGVS